MKYQPFDPVAMSPGALAALFDRLSRTASENGAPDYCPLTKERTAALLSSHASDAAGAERNRVVLWAYDGDAPGDAAGMIAGNASPGSDTGYVTVLLTDRPGGEGERIRRELLRGLTESLWAVNPGLRKLRWVFYNPDLLPWRLSGPFSSCVHPGAPGVMETDPARETLLCDGWREFAPLTAYARPLADYEIPEPLTVRMEENAARGLFTELYDPALHGSFLPLLDALGSDDWRRAVLGNAESERPLPMMIAADRSPETLEKNGGRGFVCGFAGPLRREENGRGYFAGIGIHPDYRSRGLGSCLFAALCRGLKSVGADYMTLFTGTDGTASRIYEKAGFIPAARFSAMEKTLT